MSGINFIGSYSGIDASVIDQLMKVERLPLKQFDMKKASITDELNAWKDINVRLDNLFEKTKTLQSSETFTSKISTSSNIDAVSISPSNNALEGVYKISVKQLATSANIIGGKLPSNALDEEGRFSNAGYFIIKNDDGMEHRIDITTDNTLQSLVDNINVGTNTAINASLIDGRLVLTDTKTGLRNIKLIGDGEGTLVNLGLDNVAREANEGKDSIFTINGVRK